MNRIAHPVADTPIEYPDYNRDGYGWAMAQAAIIRSGRLDSIDWENVAEEIESVGRSERSKYDSHLTNVLLHILKWDAQPALRGNSWWLSIANGRLDALKALKKNPSLKAELAEIHREALDDARKRAAIETRIPEGVFREMSISQKDAFEREFPRPEDD